MHGEGKRTLLGKEATNSWDLVTPVMLLTLKGFILQVRRTANSGKSGDLSTHVAGKGCEPWGQGRNPRAEASVSVVLFVPLLGSVQLELLLPFLFTWVGLSFAFIFLSPYTSCLILPHN